MIDENVRIIQISTTCTEKLWYIVGLGDDGNAYYWDKFKAVWVLGKEKRPEAPQAPVAPVPAPEAELVSEAPQTAPAPKPETQVAPKA